MDLGIAGRTALVTGASSGIGYGIARALGREGVRVGLAARRADRLHALASAIEDDEGPPPVVIPCDLLREDAAEHVAREARDGLRRYQF